ncbi:MAG TPA: ATP-binding protein, partial [Verrucomicrobiae bacterium]
CTEGGRSEKTITLRIRLAPAPAAAAPAEPRIQLVVEDTGIGIPPENLTRIFRHGFTTRKEGHGFGLHSGALAAKELGGALCAASPGPGLGATFTLELPVGNI